MSKLDRVSESIKNKMSLKSYNTESPHTVKETKQQKTKVTFYVPQKTMKKLNKMCSEKLLTHGKLDRSTIVCEAIELLYAKENRE